MEYSSLKTKDWELNLSIYKKTSYSMVLTIVSSCWVTLISTILFFQATYRILEEDEQEFVYPYDLGKWKNWLSVFSWETFYRHNGIVWPVVEGCDQYTLTHEQLKQKRDKQERSVVYIIREYYSGSMFPVTKGCKVNILKTAVIT